MKNCFKKIIVMFVMVLAIMGIGAIQNPTIANAATVGEELLQPEDGWTRYSYDSKEITYDGIGWFYDYKWAYNYQQTYQTPGAKIKFNFTGTKLRILSSYWNTFTNDADIIIDGKYTEKYVVYDNGKQNVAPRLVYEKLGLSNDEHSVEIINNTKEYLTINSIDIEGILLPYNENIKNKSISLNKSSLNLKEGTSEKLTATTTPSAVDIDWSSSDETVATVDSNGNVKAVKEGQSRITAKIKGTDIKTDCIVTVTKEDTVPEPIDPEQEYIINTAYAKGDNTNNASGQVSIIFKGVAEAQLKVVKTADVDSVYVGDNFTYT
ncbi:Ig domain-containing protein, partial [Clostridium botulinum]|nr:Ig domain-containing protein [Clostridium botulinum]NFI02784.1 Ig domain-containing protein [Clostridium botulinum]NFI65219.1 Ig domain-containing protein [Clostridium botulinum]NFJ45714.1 Ig domain-containing protein [Clostridium botulinum]NFJ49297.1 Ig domain-containing protein [Clostridium botulinum]